MYSNMRNLILKNYGVVSDTSFLRHYDKPQACADSKPCGRLQQWRACQTAACSKCCFEEVSQCSLHLRRNDGFASSIMLSFPLMANSGEVTFALLEVLSRRGLMQGMTYPWTYLSRRRWPVWPRVWLQLTLSQSRESRPTARPCCRFTVKGIFPPLGICTETVRLLSFMCVTLVYRGTY